MDRTHSEDRVFLPPNFSTEDVIFAVSQGAHIVDERYYSYATKVNEALQRRLNILWAIDAVNK